MNGLLCDSGSYSNYNLQDRWPLFEGGHHSNPAQDAHAAYFGSGKEHFLPVPVYARTLMRKRYRILLRSLGAMLSLMRKLIALYSGANHQSTRRQDGQGKNGGSRPAGNKLHTPAYGEPWVDADGDGDADMNLYSDGKVNQAALQKSVQNLEKGSKRKLQINIFNKKPDGSVPGAGYLHVEDLGPLVGGKNIRPNNNLEVIIGKQVADNARAITHELMHAAGVTEDNRVNNGQSIMDYRYKDDNLTSYDEALLSKLYGNV